MKESLKAIQAFSHYRIASKLGAGGMGEVYLAEDTRLRRKVALKILPEGIASDKERLRRFEQEARAASALNHPNILTIYEFGAAGGTHFLAAEFIEGETLREKINSGELSLADALNIAEQTAFALSAAHSAGIVHRDLKPENIMIRRDRVVKLLDFGLAKLIEKREIRPDTEVETLALVKTNPSVVMGTVPYMSPEQVRGKETDARTDVWSSGCVLYEMASGKLPFDGDNAYEIIASILKSEPPPLSHYDSSIPSDLERIVGKTLRKDREERYQDIKDLQIDLKDLRQELEFQAKLERSAASNKNRVKPDDEHREAQTHALEADKTTDESESVSTKSAMAHPSSNAEYLSGKLRRRKRELITVLSVFVLGAASFGWSLFSNPAENKKNFDSIAVLPFINESGSADLEYLSDGMTEALISSLSHLHSISVKARSSVFRYKGREMDSKTIGRELSVQAVLTGRVLRRAEQLTLSLELVDAETENVIWSEQYKRRETDLASLQNEIARDVSDKLRQKLTDADEKRLEERHTENTDAYQLYLQGRYQWNKRTKESLKRAVEYFQQAIDRDPSYALAYSGLADCYTVFSTYELAPPNEAYTKARLAAQKALEIDPTLAEAYATLADVRESFDWDFKNAERDYQRAIALAPNYATAHQWYGELLRKLGRPDEAVAELRRAQELDPLSLIINTSLGITLFYARGYDDAIAQLRKVIEMDSNFAVPYTHLGRCYTMKEMYSEAIAEHEKAVALTKGGSRESASLAYTLAKSGKRIEARRILEQLNEKQKRQYVDAGSLASIYFALGEKEKALDNLEKAYQEKSTSLPYIKVNPAYDDRFRSDPRFQELLRKVGFPD